MKRSKFLKSSKEMLSRSFNPSKCKMSLKLAGSRLKLLRNKKEVQVNQMKREIAQLLESGQDQTARIRVEHVIREEKMMAAYDLIEIYCELIVARMPIIESQKTCPIDLKEAIASIVFASPRCGDVPELLDVRKHFTEKYGKDFTTAAIELRPECGVSRMTGPSNFGKKSEPHVEPPHFEASNAQAPQSNNKIHGSPSNVSQLDHRTSQGAANASAQTPGPYTAFQRGRPPDATSAAQAAAESAERASMAARAAAELSSRGRIVRQYSTESHKSVGSVLKDRGPETYVKPNFSEESTNTSFSGHTRLQNEHMDGQKPQNQKTDGRFRMDDHGGRKEYSQSASLRSEASRNDNSLDHDVPVVEGYSKNNSLKEVSEDEMTRQGYRKESTSGEASQTSSHESAAVVFDKSDSDSEIYEFNLGLTYDEHGPRSYFPSSGQKSREHLSINTDSGSPMSSSSNVVKSTSSPFFTRKNSSSDLSESPDGPKLDDSVPVTFDESDGPASESDEDINVFRRTGMEDSRDFPSKKNPSVRSYVKDKSKQSVRSPFKKEASPGFDRKQWSLSSDDELKSDELDSERNQEKLFNADPPAKFNFMKPSADQPALEPKKSQMELNYIDNSSPESGEGLNFGKLTGGLRHKGYNRAPYLKKQSDRPSSFNMESKDTTTSVTKSTVLTAVGSPRISTRFENKKNARTSNLHSESDGDSSEEEEPLQKSSGHKQGKLYNLKSGKEVKTKPSRDASTSIFGSDSSDTDEDPPKESLTRKSYLRSGISQRTKASPSSSNNSYSKARLSSDAPDSDGGVGRKPINASSPETQDQFQFSKKSSSQLGSSEQPTSANVASKPNNSSLQGFPDKHNSEKANSTTMQEPKITRKSSATEESSRPQPKAETSVSNENLKAAATLNKTSSGKDDSNKKASHVHPKLPDYDALVQSLRKNRP
ncbi:UNVERIFIED_CONTAM: IST1-like protein [Sesamum radiatum]|uniref:IST1-like protein n=1 Tax=Sesamum radiatum TaxID=300843 RepID=A0AAW2NMP5_SESRA